MVVPGVMSLRLLLNALDKIGVIQIGGYDEPETHMTDSDVTFSSQGLTCELQSVICGFT